MGYAKKKHALNELDIFNYHSYRKYLRDWLADKKASQSALNANSLAKKIGISKSYMSMILKGDRTCSEKLIQLIADQLSLKPNEKSYFLLLWRIEDDKEKEVKLKSLKSLQSFQNYKSRNDSEVEAYKYLSDWYYVAIREMALLDDFQLDPRWIRNKLRKKVSLADIRQALEFLQKRGFLNVVNGKVEKPEKRIVCNEGVYKLSLSSFHKAMFEQANSSIDELDSSQRLILGHTVALGKEQQKEAKKILQQALEDIAKLDNDNQKKSEVYHFGFLSFPLTSDNNGQDV